MNLLRTAWDEPPGQSDEAGEEQARVLGIAGLVPDYGDDATFDLCLSDHFLLVTLGDIRFRVNEEEEDDDVGVTLTTWSHAASDGRRTPTRLSRLAWYEEGAEVYHVGSEQCV